MKLIRVKCGDDSQIKVGDIVGNSVWGFNFEVLEIKPGLYGIKLKNLATGEIKQTGIDNVRKKK